MKNSFYKLILCILTLGFINHSYACHNTSIDAVTYVNNNNGTTTFTIDFTIGVGSSDGNNYGFALIFKGNSGTPVVQSTPPFTPTFSIGNETLYGYAGSDIGTGNGTTYFASRYSGRTDILTYEYNGNYWLTSVTYSGTVVVTVQGCVEYIDIDGDFRSLGTAIANQGCLDTYGTNINCCTPTAGTFDTTLCNGTSFNFNGTLYNGSNLSGIETITNVMGCDSFVTVTVTELPQITGTFDTTICSSSSFVYNGTIYNSSNTNGTENLISSNGCDSIVSVSVTLQSSINVNIDTTLCNGASITINGTIYNGANKSGTEIIPISGGCDSVINISVTELPSLTGNFNTTICNGESIVVNGTTYNANNPNGTEIYLSKNGCDSTVTVTITELPVLSGTFDTSICRGESFSFNGTLYDEYNLQGTETLNGSSSCDSIVSVNVQIKEPPTVNAYNQNPVICRGEQALLYATGATSYNWEGESSDTIVKQPSTTTTYFVTGYDANGCSNSSEATVVVEYCSDLYIPNAFSPNGDGQNDYFRLHGDIREMELMIFNRWGEKVFESNDQSNYWDGTFHGHSLSSGVFVYVARLDLYQDKIITKKGNITLIK